MRPYSVTLLCACAALAIVRSAVNAVSVLNAFEAIENFFTLFLQDG